MTRLTRFKVSKSENINDGVNSPIEDATSSCVKIKGNRKLMKKGEYVDNKVHKKIN